MTYFSMQSVKHEMEPNLCDTTGEKKRSVMFFFSLDIHYIESSVLEGLCGELKGYISKAIKKDSKRGIV